MVLHIWLAHVLRDSQGIGDNLGRSLFPLLGPLSLKPWDKGLMAYWSSFGFQPPGFFLFLFVVV